MKLFIKVILTLLLINTKFSLAQTEPKGKYDDVDFYSLDPFTFINLSATNDNGSIGDNQSYQLLSLVNMYQTTGDRAYLIKCIKYSFRLMEVRNTSHLWSEINKMYSTRFYQDALIVLPMSKMVHIIKMGNLNKETFPASNIIETSESNLSITNFNYQNFNTYGEFADWLAGQIEWVYTTYNDYYDTDNGFRDGSSTASALSMNLQAPMAAGMLYLGHAYINNTTAGINSTAWLECAYAVGSLYRSNPHLINFCTSQTYNENIFKLNTAYNFYYWFHHGWSFTLDQNCPGIQNQPDIDKNLEFTEDISHGIQDLFVPLAFVDIYGINNGYFDEVDMVRWRNTFSHAIYAGNGNFHNTISGADDHNYPCSRGLPPESNSDYALACDLNFHKPTALAWAPLASWDAAANSSPDTYDITNNLYYDEFESNGSITALASFGLAAFVEQKQNRGCTDLYLKNRRLPYNQDFSAGNSIIIDPLRNNPDDASHHSFADPIITEQTFTIESGVTSNIYAGYEVVLKNGATIKAGSDVRIYTDPTLLTACQNGERLSQSSENSNEARSSYIKPYAGVNKKLNEVTSVPQNTARPVKLNFNIAPNPNTGSFTLTTNLSNSNVSITNILGEVVYSTQSNSSANEINLSGKSKGIYFVNVKGENVNEITKAVIE